MSADGANSCTGLVYFCAQCGPLRGDHPVDEDGRCGSCGAATCSWKEVIEHVRDAGYIVTTRDELASNIREVLAAEPDMLSGALSAVAHRLGTQS